MKLVFFGTARFAVPALDRFAGAISLVVTQPERPSGRGMQARLGPVGVRARELGLPLEMPVRSKDPAVVQRVAAERADALLVAAYGQILSEAMLASAINGGINIHGSILPAYRGAAPIQRAILAGETSTGVTLMQMDRGMDTGGIFALATTPIGEHETSGELESKLGVMGADLAVEWLPRIVAGRCRAQPQDDREASYAPKIARAEAELNPNDDVRAAYNRFRAFTPLPGAFLQTRKGPVTIEEAKPATPGVYGPAGTILEAKASLVLAFANGALELRRVRPAGKKSMTGLEFANGMRWRAGSSILE